MRLRHLSLDYFGHFTGKSYDFGDGRGASDFHVIYGPNEAGKTTTMEAVLRLLYGFPTRETYDFQHQRKTLQVSGTIEAEGTAQKLVRMTGRKGALTDATGAVLPETAVSAHLGGLGLDDYRMLLCLDDETIEKGGEAIAASKGDIGRLLFSAAAGLGDLGAVLDQAGTQADALYRKRASSTTMAALKKELAEVDRAIRDGDVSASAFARLKSELAQAQELEAQLRDERDAQARAQAQVAAQLTALPLVMEYDALAAQIADKADFPATLDITAEALVGVLTEDSKAEADIARLDDEIAALETRIDGLTLHPDRQELVQVLAGLDDLRSRFVTAGRDLPRRRDDLRGFEAQMAEVARQLEAGAQADGLVLTAVQIQRLERARDAARTATQAAAAEAREVAALEERLREAEAVLAGQGAEPDSGIGALLDRYAADSLQGAYATARAEVDTAEAALRTALDGLHFKGQDFDAVPACPLSLQEAQALATQHAEASRDKAQALETMREHRGLAEEAKAQIARSTAQVGQIGDAEAQAKRDTRDAMWAAHSAALSAETAERFAQAMAQSDSVSDARLAHARALADLRAAELAQTRAETRAEQAGQAAEAAQDRIDAATGTATEAAAGAGLLGFVTPADLAVWVAAQGLARAAEQKLKRCAGAHRATLDKAAALAAELAPLIDLHDPEFATLIDAARRRAAQERGAAEAVAQAGRARDGCAQDLKARTETLQALTQEKEGCARAWTEGVRMTLGGRVQPEVLEATLDPLRTLATLNDQRAGMAERVGKLEADQAQFTALMAELGQRHGVEGDDAGAIFEALRKLAEQATAAGTLHTSLMQALEQARAGHAAAEDSRAAIARKVAVWADAFPAHVDTGTLSDLRAAVQDATTVIAARARMAELDTQARLALSVDRLDAARAVLDDTTSAGLEAERATLETESAGLTARLETAIAARANAQSALTAITGDTDIAQLTERRATLELELEDCALTYLELRMGQRLAEEALRRYRDSHRSGMMQATETAFCTLTGGAYTRLGTQPGANGAETLLVLDASGTSKQAQDLSKGTRFQLYLALRAAAYQQLVETGVSLPFLCDDIFETFDEDRTAAACLMMEDIGQRGQAIYLTHHRHVVEIAKQVCAVPPTIHMIG
ncbi:YhaN family protein [Sulfitobacter sp. 20_GPM-1509m]|uniref:YhaN family protein n=1 Tax=Sulfitobacter sp. 20_GPM-1509m TaxID=1380367 RepID=UPI00048FD71B|nr:YhaN family protein [Sulfitobacter sp. 20_GPM-1509m]